MVHRREDHAELEANQHGRHHHLVDETGVRVQIVDVADRQAEEQKQPKDVTPDVDRLVRPPEDALDAQFRRQIRAVAVPDERIELQVFGRLFVWGTTLRAITGAISRAIHSHKHNIPHQKPAAVAASRTPRRARRASSSACRATPSPMRLPKRPAMRCWWRAWQMRHASHRAS